MSIAFSLKATPDGGGCVLASHDSASSVHRGSQPMVPPHSPAHRRSSCRVLELNWSRRSPCGAAHGVQPPARSPQSTGLPQLIGGRRNPWGGRTVATHGATATHQVTTHGTRAPQRVETPQRRRSPGHRRNVALQFIRASLSQLQLGGRRNPRGGKGRRNPRGGGNPRGKPTLVEIRRSRQILGRSRHAEIARKLTASA